MGAVLSASKSNVYEAVTAQIVAAIEAGAGTWVMPWHGGVVPMKMPVNAATEKPYHGVNVVALWAQATNKLYHSAYWASYQQWQSIGGQVRKGERSSLIVFYKKLDGEEEPDAGDAADAPRFVVRWSHVFNAAQVEGWDHPAGPPSPSQVELDEQVEAFVRATKADIRYGFPRAFYRRSEDFIAMPAPHTFTGTPTSSPSEAFYAVLLHELTHWTGAPHRLDRTKGKRVGDLAYAFEELVAELGAAFLCSAFGIVNEPRADHAAYIAHWLDILGQNNGAIFKAAGLAQEAVQYLRGLATAESGL
jgi:antirestriction protein ArdC